MRYSADRPEAHHAETSAAAGSGQHPRNQLSNAEAVDLPGKNQNGKDPGRASSHTRGGHCVVGQVTMSVERNRLTSIISSELASDLHLKTGDNVVALVKFSQVMILRNQV